MCETNPVDGQHAESWAEASRRKSPSLLERLEQHFQRYAALAPGLPLVLAVWGVATYLYEGFDCFPYLAITSPTKRCGKTRTAELLEFVCANPLRTVGISVAALFRTIEQKGPSLLIDEAESLRGRDERTSALREILNAGYKRGQKVIRCEGGNRKKFQPREFETFCPKVLILIGSLPETLADRCIPVQMRRRTSERLERFRFSRVKTEAGSLRSAAKQWARRNRRAVERWYQANDILSLTDREAELWLPLFAVCALADPKRLTDLEGIARQLSGVKAQSEPGDFGIRLLTDIRAIFVADGGDRVTTTNLLSRLNAVQDSPWPNWSNGRSLDARSLANLLRPYGIQPKNTRLGETVLKGYEKTDFEDAWSRYLDASAAASATGPISQQDRSDSASATQAACSASENEANANIHAGCSGVADEMLLSLVDVATAVED